MMLVDSMMSIEADNMFCANCVMHNWKQPVDKSSLKHCHGCLMILYCGEACRKEHWRNVHKNHCQFLADPTKCPQSQHDAESCAICRSAAGTGKGKRRMAGRERKRNPASSSYECITKDMPFAPGLASPHPFPVAGVRDDLLEKFIIVIQNLVHKIKQNPRVAMACSDELDGIERFLWSKRREIWRHRKVFSHPRIVYMSLELEQIRDLVNSVTSKVSQGKAGKDASELWKITQLVLVIVTVIATYDQQDALKNPIDSMPEQFRDLVKLALNNKFEVLDIAEEIIDSLSTQVIPYEDIVKKLCGGKKRQNCSFCGGKIEVTEYFGIGPLDNKCSSVLFNSLSVRKYRCGREDCHTKASARNNDMLKLSLAVAAAFNEPMGSSCDFCFQLCPIEKAHRCCNCLTVMYCSKSCHKEDKVKNSKKYCIQDERKIKKDRSMRRQMGEMTPGRMAVLTADCMSEYRVAIINEALEAFQFEDTKSKKRDGDNPDTERKDDTSIPAAATVPTAEDDRSKLDTVAAPNAEYINDRITQCAGAAADPEHTLHGSKSGYGAASNAEYINDRITQGAGAAADPEHTLHGSKSGSGAPSNAEDDRSKSDTVAAPNADYINDRIAQCAGAAADTEHAHDGSKSGAGAAGGPNIFQVG